uniref:RNA-dependent RNA polymerase n=1 Tax=Diaporthe helianthi qinvirus 1 TaxID=3077441 RepID=A0AA96HA17_9VIRU|nr:MAG: RNA-dependent RNA polymerase [Diaporthe helianthi qinvirus 1]
MARVYERPRYLNQVRNKLLALATKSGYWKFRHDLSQILALDSEENVAMFIDYEDIAHSILTYEPYEDAKLGVDTPLVDYLTDAEIGNIIRSRTIKTEVAAYNFTKDLLDTYNHLQPTKVLTDEQAMFSIMWFAYNCKTLVLESRASQVARSAARSLMVHQAIGQKIGPGNINNCLAGSAACKPIPQSALIADAWQTAGENLEFRAQPMWVKYCRLWALGLTRLRPRARDMVEKVHIRNAWERHEFHPFDDIYDRSYYKAYNYSGIIVLYIEKTMHIIDSATCSYLRTAFTARRNAYWAFSMYRISGVPTAIDYSAEYQRCEAWIARSLEDPVSARYLARHMHLTFTLWLNSACEEGAPVYCGHLERAASLQAEILEYYPHNLRWWDLINSLGVNDRAKGEFLKLYHLLPPPDIDQVLLHDTILETTSNANPVDTEAVDEFIKFCKSYDLVRHLSKRRRVPRYATDADYTPNDSQWWTRSLSGNLTMPPKEDWGRAWIQGEYPFDHSSDFHVLDAKDATRIVADSSLYMDRSRHGELTNVMSNELLSAIFHGSVLSNGMTMPDWRKRVANLELDGSDEAIAAEAGKAENTKPGTKVRETLSACDTVREILSEVDHAIRSLASVTPGVSIRVDQVTHKRKFQRMAHAISSDDVRFAFATSADVSGWSPRLPRELFYKWQEYALTMTTCENPTAHFELWRRLHLFVDRRGVKKISPVTGGNMQGWPATSDTTMHAHMLVKWVYMLHDAGIISNREKVFTLCLIDDAAAVMVLEGTAEECRVKAERAVKLMVDFYKSLGFIIDDIKSFFSSIKFIYLNELYADGTQVFQSCKTIMRIDRDHTRRFASLTDSISVAYGTAASACNQGADPISAYWIASWIAYKWLFQVRPDMVDLPHRSLTVFAMAPVGLNGLGIRPISAVFCTGQLDTLTWYIEVIGALCATIKDDVTTTVFEGFLTQKLATKTAQQVLLNPFGVSADTHRDASATVSRAFRDAAMSAGLAEPFASLAVTEDDPDFDAAVENVISTGRYEAALLEEVGSSMPLSFVQETMARVDKTELISFLLGGRGIGNLRRRVQLADLSNLATASDILRCTPKLGTLFMDFYDDEEVGSFGLASAMRDESYARSGYRILNHTYPCPYGLWAFAGDIDLESPRAERLTTASFNMNRLRFTAGSATRNMYDSGPVGNAIGFKGYRTAKSSIENDVRVQLYNPVRKKIAAGCTALRWAQAMGAHYRGLQQLFLRSWSDTADPSIIEVMGAETQAAVKRISLRHVKTNHMITCMPNTQSSVVINTRAITRAQAGTSHMYDIMAAINALRTSMLIEAATRLPSGVQQFAYGFSYKRSSESTLAVPPPDTVTFDAALIQSVRPFTEIKCELQSSARIVTSSDAMRLVQQTYLDAGLRAADVAMADMIEANELPEGALRTGGGEVAADVNVLTMQDMTGSALNARSAWYISGGRRRADDAGLVIAGEATQQTSVGTLFPNATNEELVRFSARRNMDTRAIELVESNSSMAAMLSDKYRRQRVIDVASDEWLSDNVTRFTLSATQLRRIVREVDLNRGNIPSHQAVGLALAEMGVNGWRSVAVVAGEQLLHSLQSFLGTAVAINAQVASLARRLSNLKKQTDDDYSRVTIAGGRARDAARIIRAHWRLAAARYQNRADALAEQNESPDTVTSLNYRSVYAGCAAKTLTQDGRLDIGQFNRECIESTLSSLSNHLVRGGGLDAFEDAVDAGEVALVDGEATDEVVVEKITALCQLAARHANDIRPLIMIEKYTEVRGWIDSDISGSPIRLIAVGRRVRMTAASSAAVRSDMAIPVIAQSAEDLALAAIFSGMVTAGADDDDETDPYDVAPHQMMAWLADVHRSRLPYAGVELSPFYDRVTRSRAAWNAFLQNLGVDLSEFEEPMVSRFRVVTFGDDNDVGIEE